ncbi:MAG: hypothetical protein JW944_07935 [Deltaproteobacteria bacterium]|nr:hypothetical protein [Deltaproteobacteria bacterium]
MEKKHNVSDKMHNLTLALVLKADTAGTSDAVLSGLENFDTDNLTVRAIHWGIGSLSKSDIFAAESGSRLLVGFNVGPLPGVKELAAEKGVEIRLYDVIYRLLEDIKSIAQSMAPYEDQELITGAAKVIALFKGGHRGTILGCEVLDGMLETGKKFRLISDPGTVYTGTIESLHIETEAVRQARQGQKVGLKISGFKRAKIGDLVECFEIIPDTHKRWQPKGGLFDLRTRGGSPHA